MPALRTERRQPGELRVAHHNLSEPSEKSEEAQTMRPKKARSVLLIPGDFARFDAAGSDMALLHMVVPKPPAAVEDGLPGGPGYFFGWKTPPENEKGLRSRKHLNVWRARQDLNRRPPGS
jgi:hypothetical protein